MYASFSSLLVLILSFSPCLLYFSFLLLYSSSFLLHSSPFVPFSSSFLPFPFISFSLHLPFLPVPFPCTNFKYYLNKHIVLNLFPFAYQNIYQIYFKWQFFPGDALSWYLYPRGNCHEDWSYRGQSSGDYIIDIDIDSLLGSAASLLLRLILKFIPVLDALKLFF